ncbi:helix-turn-helix transcriptional regulator [Actinosynnema sp. NPDC059797]
MTLEQAGLPPGTNRRVPGLRRTEVAAPAGVSIEYYSKLERGALAGFSAGVLDAVAHALRLDEAERAHLFDLRAFHSPVYADRHAPPNLARFQFLDPAARRFHPNWDLAADTSVAILRTEAGRNPHDKGLHDLVGELSTRSDEFRRRWGAHDVRHHGTGSKTFHHPLVGDLTLAYEGLEMAAEPGLTLTIYTAEPGSASEDALRVLASWAASHDPTASHHPASHHPAAHDPAAHAPAAPHNSAAAREHPAE